MRRKETYRKLGADYFDQLDRERTTKRLVRRLERLGYRVTLGVGQPIPATQSGTQLQAFAQAHALAFSHERQVFRTLRRASYAGSAYNSGVSGLAATSPGCKPGNRLARSPALPLVTGEMRAPSAK